jgi:C1A family cysteine protease
MSFFDVEIDNTIDISQLLYKTTFQINQYQINKLDLTSLLPSFENYELLGSTANAIATLIEYDIKTKVSRMFIYFIERLNTNTYNINNSIKNFLEYGYCLNDDYKYNPSLINEEPSKDIYKKALENKYKFDVVKIKKDLNSLILSIINNEPFIVSIDIYESFNISSNIIQVPLANEKRVGAISIVVCGFNNEKHCFIIRFLNKNYELPYIYLLKDGYSSNCFIFVYRLLKINLNIEEVKKEDIQIQNQELKKVDLRPKFPPAYDQGKIGSCSSFALCSIFDYDTTNFKGSHLFLYYNERELINEVNEDNGAYLSDGIYSLKKNGICDEKYWEYKIENIFVKPSNEAYEKAKENYVIEAYNINNDLTAIKKWLDNNEPIAIGISIYSNFMSYTSKTTGKIGMPASNDNFIGGHAVIICGYDDNSRELILRNSWGTYWGDNGYFYLPYDYLKFCGDLWIITKSFNSLMASTTNPIILP